MGQNDPQVVYHYQAKMALKVHLHATSRSFPEVVQGALQLAIIDVRLAISFQKDFWKSHAGFKKWAF